MTDYTIVMQGGRPYKVPVEHAKKFIRKNELVTRAMTLKDALKSEQLSVGQRFTFENELREVMSKIIRINRKIPPCAIPM